MCAGGSIDIWLKRIGVGGPDPDLGGVGFCVIYRILYKVGSTGKYAT